MIYATIIILVSLLIGLSKGGMGAVLVTLVTPLLSMVMPVSHAVSTALPLLLIADVFALWIYRHRWDMRYIRLMLPLAVIGVIAGTILLALLPDIALRRILGLFTLVFVAYKLFGDRLMTIQYQPRDWHGYLAGCVSGLGAALANTGAPPFTAYLLLQDVSPVAFAGTATLFFAVVNLLKLPGLIIARLLDLHDLIAIAWAIPIIPFGVWAGRWLINRIDRLAFERLMLVVLALASLVLIFVSPQ